MLLGEPAPTQADLKFSVLGIPVRVSPWFWAMSFLLGIRGSEADPREMIIWVIAVFISILIHELGHALTARRYGNRARITLHGMGGLASYDGGNNSIGTEIKVTAAGPGAGFLLAALIVGISALLGGHLVFSWSLMPVRVYFPNASESLYLFINSLLFVNILWGLFNLLPIYPLDGGQITRMVWVHNNTWEGIRKSLIVSLMTCIFMAIWFLIDGERFMPIMMAWLAYGNYQSLQANTGGGGGYGGGYGSSGRGRDRGW